MIADESTTIISHITTSPTMTGGSPDRSSHHDTAAANNNKPNINSFISGVVIPEHLTDATIALANSRQDGFDYAVVALPNTVPLLTTANHSSNSSDGSDIVSGDDDVPRTDVIRLESKWWSTSIVGMIVDPPQLNDDSSSSCSDSPLQYSPNNKSILLERLTSSAPSSSASSPLATQKKKEEAHKIFWGMMEWASHMNIPAVILPSVPLNTATVVRHANNKEQGSSIANDDSSIKKKNKQDNAQIHSSEEEDMFAKEDDDNNGEKGKEDVKYSAKSMEVQFSSPNNNMMKNDDTDGPQSKRGRVGSPSPSALTSSLPTTNASTLTTATNTKLSINTPASKEYARLLSNLATSSICTSSNVQLWIRVPLTIQDLQAYQLLLARCDYASSVGCMIYINSRIDYATELPAIVRAIHGVIGGGHVKAVSWDTSIFLKNKKGYPTLSKSHQSIFALLYGRLGRTLRTLIEGQVVPPSCDNNDPMIQQVGSSGGSSLRLHHLQYLRHLRSKPKLLCKLDTEEGILETPYLDNLQSPLQPLGDHLEYQTYETFEKDPVKYERYGKAVEYALEDGFDENKFAYLGSTRTVLPMDHDDDDYYGNNNDMSDQDREIVEVDMYEVIIMVVGAGRGPLVRESISALSRVSASLTRTAPKKNERRKALHAKIVAIEKNPSAVLYLQSLKGSDPSWNGGQEYEPMRSYNYNTTTDASKVIPGTSNVFVIGCDMREARSHPILQLMIHNAKSRADIVVSELLGSFGDNELSPECLDGVQACGILKDDCFSIPQNYTAYIAPVSSARLYSEARMQSCYPLNTNEGPASPSVGMQRALETPYVVRSHAASQTHNEQACWTFSHPHQTTQQQEAAATSNNMDTSDNSKLNPSAKAAESINNDRHAHLSFRYDPTLGIGNRCGYGAFDSEVASMATSGKSTINDTSTMTFHGLLGSFHSVLYESKRKKREQDGPDESRSSVISIAPSSFSVGMFSWFPLYFPFKEPLRLPPRATVNCSIWRQSDEGRVWYEWSAEVVHEEHDDDDECIWGTSSVHNPGGRSYHVKK